MLRALVAAVVLATAYCGAKGPPHPPVSEAADAGEAGAAADAGAP
jgi:predicted small lipoprotein YifL